VKILVIYCLPSLFSIRGVWSESGGHSLQSSPEKAWRTSQPLLFKWSNYGIHSLQSAPEKARTNSQPLQQRYTFTRYGMNCIHQPTGKPLEWMGWINTNTGAAGYTKSLEGRIELIKDNSVSMTRLKLSGLKSEDSAVYYWVQ
uniref:Immunoglobulin V-set domain-containing protein n=1 Tax=Oncorhynchus tshawytscha TaxID=74940 RepID=A0AAZ3SF54_ONCTS